MVKLVCAWTRHNASLSFNIDFGNHRLCNYYNDDDDNIDLKKKVHCVV